MHSNAELIQKFYRAFQSRDGKTMAECYHTNASFSDPVFPYLDGAETIGRMWQMLCKNSTDLEITFLNIHADNETGGAHWEAKYTFAKERHVHNIIEAKFRFEDGLIIEHHDQFSFWRWSRMALGIPGWLLGWTPLLQTKVQRQAANRLKKHMDYPWSNSDLDSH